MEPTKRSLLYLKNAGFQKTVYAGHYGFYAEKVQIVAQLSFPCRIEIRALSKSTTIIGVKDFFNDVKDFFKFALRKLFNR